MQCSAKKRGVSTPLRFYKREWTRYKPHLPKSVSLPILKLLPTDRPIFTCRQCGFINTLIPLCLWCCWSSEAARQEFERLTPRARRASTPPKIVWKLDHQGMVNVASELATLQSVRHDCLSTRLSSQTKSHVLRDQQARPLIRTSEATVADFHVADFHVANATSCDILISRSYSPILKRYYSQDSDSLFEKPRRPSWLDDSLSEKSSTAGVSSPHPFPRFHHSLSTGVDRRTPMHLIKTTSTKSLRSAHIVIDFKTLHESYAPIKPNTDNSLVKQGPPTPKTLRRKKRLPLYRPSTPRPDSTGSSTFSTSSPTGVSQPQSLCTADDHHLSDLGRETKSQTHARSRSQPTDFTRLGHPSRPLYTAIRPNMSPVKTSNDPGAQPPSNTPFSLRLSCPISLPTPSRAPSLGIMSVLSSTSVLYDEDDAGFEPFTYQSHASSHHSRKVVLPSAIDLISQRRTINGFSLSGETELRMALAQSGGDNHDTFRFKDMGKRRGGFSVMKKIRELKKGLKEFILRSHH